MWQTIGQIASALTLIAFAVAVIAAVLRRRLLSRERQLLSAPEEARPALVQALNDSFLVPSLSFDPNLLSREQKYQIILAQIHDRSRRFYATSVLVAFLACIAAAVAVYALSKSPTGEREPKDPALRSNPTKPTPDSTSRPTSPPKRSYWPPGVVPASSDVCTPGPGTLCLLGGRFRAQTTWVRRSSRGIGVASTLQENGGVFAEVQHGPPALALSILDARGLTNSFWVFLAKPAGAAANLTITDLATGAVKEYVLPPQSAAEDTTVRLTVSPFAGTCVANRDELCLLGGRVKVRLVCIALDGDIGPATAVPYSKSGGLFRCNEATLDLVVNISRTEQDSYTLAWSSLTQVGWAMEIIQTHSNKSMTLKRTPEEHQGLIADLTGFMGP